MGGRDTGWQGDAKSRCGKKVSVEIGLGRRQFVAASLQSGQSMGEGDAMSNPLKASEVLNREFLEVRARLLQVAAALDRLDRAEGSVDDDPRYQNIHRVLEVLSGAKPGRAEQVQMILSRPYSSKWQESFDIARKR
jgi:hypothetical protein